MIISHRQRWRQRKPRWRDVRTTTFQTTTTTAPTTPPPYSQVAQNPTLAHTRTHVRRILHSSGGGGADITRLKLFLRRRPHHYRRPPTDRPITTAADRIHRSAYSVTHAQHTHAHKHAHTHTSYGRCGEVILTSEN